MTKSIVAGHCNFGAFAVDDHVSKPLVAHAAKLAGQIESQRTIKSSSDTETRLTTTERCTLTAIAVERYRLANGRLPETLESLVPEYLDRVPIDPFIDEPLCDKAKENGFGIYAVGNNLVDDDGVIGPRDADWGIEID